LSDNGNNSSWNEQKTIPLLLKDLETENTQYQLILIEIRKAIDEILLFVS
jgi:hypothetical protein